MDSLVHFSATLFVILFLVGVVGSLVVVVVSFVEDFELLVESDDEANVDAAVTRA